MSMGSYQMVTVQRGDCLWTIAQRYLGDGDRFREILKLNLGHHMGGGQVFTDPSVIWTGWVLQLPANSTAAPSQAAPATPADTSAHSGHASADPAYSSPHPGAQGTAAGAGRATHPPPASHPFPRRQASRRPPGSRPRRRLRAHRPRRPARPRPATRRRRPRSRPASCSAPVYWWAG